MSEEIKPPEKVEAPKIETPKIEVPKVEAKKKVEAPKSPIRSLAERFRAGKVLYSDLPVYEAAEVMREVARIENGE